MMWAGTHEVADRVPGSYAFLLLPLGYLALPGVFPAWVWAGATVMHVAVLAIVAAGVSAAVVGRMRRD